MNTAASDMNSQENASMNAKTKVKTTITRFLPGITRLAAWALLAVMPALPANEVHTFNCCSHA